MSFKDDGIVGVLTGNEGVKTNVQIDIPNETAFKIAGIAAFVTILVLIARKI